MKYSLQGSLSTVHSEWFRFAQVMADVGVSTYLKCKVKAIKPKIGMGHLSWSLTLYRPPRYKIRGAKNAAKTC